MKEQINYKVGDKVFIEGNGESTITVFNGKIYSLVSDAGFKFMLNIKAINKLANKVKINKVFYKVDSKPTKELIEKFDNDNNTFYRFQEPERKLTSRSKSWGMIYSSAKEAIRYCEEYGWTKEEAVLPGKSCMPTFKEIISGKWITQFNNEFVLLVFEGEDTGVTGHDGEYVAKYNKKVAVWNYEDVVEYAKENNLW